MTGMNRKIFGLRVREARSAAHLTSDQLSERCNCTPVSIRQIESGIRLPSLPKLVALCNALHVSPNDLLRAELDFDFQEAPGSGCDRRMEQLVATVRTLSPSQIETVCATTEALIEHLRPKSTKLSGD